MRHGIRLLMGFLAMCMMHAHAATPVPEPLREWQSWVMNGQEFRACPFFATRRPGDVGAHVCAWPGALVLDLGATGGTFSQRWQVHAESWVRLPGNLEHWPRDVRLDGAPAPVVARNGVPQLSLSAGAHEVSGRFSWESRPEQLAVPLQTALVQLTVDGRAVPQPERPGNAVWLGQRRTAVERDQLDLRVYRLLRDEIPARLVTVISLQVAGSGREVLIGPVLPSGFVPLALEGDLPARLENDGRLRVQLRPGVYELSVEARAASVAAAITRPEAAAPWPAEEVWSFETNDRLRVAGAEGAETIDAAQANVPDDWSGHPAYRMPAGATLTVVERSRALANPDDNRLGLARNIWLDFDHSGFTLTDYITGRLNRDWRLDMAPPYLLESAQIGRNLLVTSGPGDSSGVELRQRDLALSTIARFDGARASMPATGWSSRFEDASGVLHLPPGHRLLGAPGADYAYGSWIDSWGLWNLFGVLVVIVLAHWVAGPLVAIAAAIALVLLYQEQPQMIWLWANAIGAIALLRAVPEGRLRTFAVRYRIASFVVLALALLPLLIGQLRLVIYPHLDVGARSQYLLARNVAAQDMADARERSVMMEEPPMAALPAPAAPPPPRAQAEGAGGAFADEDSELTQVQVTGSRVTSVTDRYAPGTQLQSGPGVPAWEYLTYRYGWSGPVESGQSVRFVWLGPVGMGLWRTLGVLATALFALLLAQATFRFPLNLPAGARRLLERGAATSLAALLLFAPGDPAQAQAFPSNDMLNELRTRLTAAPPCVGSCAEIVSASVRANGERLEVDLSVSALADVAVALPQAGDRWQLDRVEVDGRAAPFALRESDTAAWLPLTRGAHTVRLAGRLANAETVQLGFPQAPRAINASSSGWDTAGISNGRLLSGSLELIRRRAAGSTAAQLAPSEFAPFVHVTRTFRLGLDWTINNVVERIAPRAAPLQVQVPLAPGESVTTDGAEVGGDGITVPLARGQHAYSWSSVLARSESLALTLPANAARTEHWQFRVGLEWHLAFEGFPPSLPESDSGEWVFHYFPRPGETLNVTITRPAPMPGRTLAIDAARHHGTFGRRSIDGSLELRYRSTQAGRHLLTLPQELRVSEVTLDGESILVRPENGQLPLTLSTGVHEVRIAWTSPRGAGFLVRPDRIDLGAPASNVTTTIALPDDRWPLVSYGRGVGTSILYWGELVVFLLLAFALSRWRHSPLRFHEWLLLGLGLSTLSWPVFAIVAAWLLVMRWRAGWNHATTGRWMFLGAQVLLAACTVIALSSLVFSGIRYGLLATPDMSLAGGEGGYGAFQWFLDRTDSTLPQPVIFSVPMWVYRLLMFAWAAWIAVALRRWLPQAWQAWTAGGFWRGRVIVPPPPRAREA